MVADSLGLKYPTVGWYGVPTKPPSSRPPGLSGGSSQVESELDALLGNINKESYVCSFKTNDCKRVYKKDDELWEQDMILIDEIFLDKKYK